MTDLYSELDPQLADWFEALRLAPERDAQKTAASRERFLSQARILSLSAAAPQTQAGGVLPFLPAWARRIFHPGQHGSGWKPSFALGMLLVVILLLGISSSTVLAAQFSLPDQPLYALKLWSEDLRLVWAQTPEQKLAVLLDFSDRRVHEIAALEQSGQPAPQHVLDAYQDELESSLDLAALLESSSTGAALQAIARRARQQGQALETLPTSSQDRLRQAQAAAEETADLAELGLTQLEQFRLRLQQRRQGIPAEPSTEPQAIPDATAEPVLQPEAAPAAPQDCSTDCPATSEPAAPHPAPAPLRRAPFGDPPQELNPGLSPWSSSEGEQQEPHILPGWIQRGTESGTGSGEGRQPGPRRESSGQQGGSRRP